MTVSKYSNRTRVIIALKIAFIEPSLLMPLSYNFHNKRNMEFSVMMKTEHKVPFLLYSLSTKPNNDEHKKWKDKM